MIDRIVQYIESLNLANPMLAYAQIFLAVFFIVSAYFSITYLINHHWFSMKFAKIKNDVDEQRKLRKEEYERRYILEGETEQDTVFQKLDGLILDAGLKSKYSELNADNFLMISFGICLIVSLFAGIWTHSFVTGIIAAIITFVVIISYLEVKAIKNYVKIETQLLKFMNNLDNVSTIERTIGEMLGRTVQYLAEPLKTPIEQCYYEIKSGVATDDALKSLSTKINHKKFRSIINSLRVCAAHNENYAEVIEESKEDVKNYVSFKRQMRAIRKNSLVELFILGIAGAAICGALTLFVDNVFETIFRTTVGLCFIAYLVLVVGIGIVSTLRKERE